MRNSFHQPARLLLLPESKKSEQCILGARQQTKQTGDQGDVRSLLIKWWTRKAKAWCLQIFTNQHATNAPLRCKDWLDGVLTISIRRHQPWLTMLCPVFFVLFSWTWFLTSPCPRRLPRPRRPSAYPRRPPPRRPPSRRSHKPTPLSPPPACTMSVPCADATRTSTTCPYLQVQTDCLEASLWHIHESWFITSVGKSYGNMCRSHFTLKLQIHIY